VSPDDSWHAGDERDVASAKRALRTALRRRRRALTADLVASCSAAACTRVVESRAFADALHVVLYAATDGELVTDGIERAAREAGKCVYYPRVTERGMVFVRDRAGARRAGRRGIPEPTSDEPLGPDAGVLFIVPGVAFDLRGNRLGRGLGAYDRALLAYPDARRLGLGYEFQLLPVVPIGEHDVRLDGVVTEARAVGVP
jgi:5-formyltetrahydrofolate cyclo-ligase